MVLLFTGVRGTCLRSAELSPLGTWRKHERAVGDAGPYGVRLSSCAGIRETADMDATVPLHDNRPARLRAVRGSGSGDGVQAIRCGTFLYRGWNRTREIQKPLVFGGVLFHISFAVERNMAAGGIEKKVVGPLRPKVTRARERGIFPPEGAIQAPPVADTAR